LIEENQTNENEMDIEEVVERGENEKVQTNNRKVEKIWKQIIKKNLEKLHVQRNFWRGHNINFLCLGILLCE
jgi:hypothetical protein